MGYFVGRAPRINEQFFSSKVSSTQMSVTPYPPNTQEEILREHKKLLRKQQTRCRNNISPGYNDFIAMSNSIKSINAMLLERNALYKDIVDNESALYTTTIETLTMNERGHYNDIADYLRGVPYSHYEYVESNKNKCEELTIFKKASYSFWRKLFRMHCPEFVVLTRYFKWEGEWYDEYDGIVCGTAYQTALQKIAKYEKSEQKIKDGLLAVKSAIVKKKVFKNDPLDDLN